MNALLIVIDGHELLLPVRNNYDFPAYILEHRDRIKAHIDAYKKFTSHMHDDAEKKSFLEQDYVTGLPDLKEFKKKTGIVGAPLDTHDPKLYALNKGFYIVLRINM